MPDEGVMDLGLDTNVESVETVEQEQPDDLQELGGDKEIDGRKFSKEYREWLKTFKTDPTASKWAKQSYNDYGRMQAISQLDPKGVDGVRETYEFLNSIQTDDGLTGREAVQQFQERLAQQAEIDAAIADGDARAFDLLGEDFNEGLAKLGPAYLDRWAKIDPEGYAANLQPILFNQVCGSALNSNLVEMERILLDQGLNPEQKLAKLNESMGKIGDWYQTNKQLAEQSKQRAAQENPWKQKYEERMAQDAKASEDAFWGSGGQLQTSLAPYEKDVLMKAATPYLARFTQKLDDAGRNRLAADLRSEMKNLGMADQKYLDQMNAYRKMKSPNPAAITNFVKGNIAKYAPKAVEKVMSQPPWSYLVGKNGNRTVPAPNGKGAPVSAGGRMQNIVMVSQKPAGKDVDWNAWNRMSSKEKYSGIYPLKDKRIVQVQKNRA